MFKLYRKQIINTDINTAWNFFSSPHNLKEITPPKLNLKVTSNSDLTIKNPEIYPGMIITYQVTPLLNIKINWMTEITNVRAPYFFSDQQLHGPYKVWNHEHHFTEVENGILIEDLVNYALPFEPFSLPVNTLFVRKELEKIFDFRKRILVEQFNS